MGQSDQDSNFIDLLDKLREAHSNEVIGLRTEVERLQARLWVAEGPGGSAIDQYILQELGTDLSSDQGKEEKGVDFEMWASVLIPQPNDAPPPARNGTGHANHRQQSAEEKAAADEKEAAPKQSLHEVCSVALVGANGGSPTATPAAVPAAPPPAQPPTSSAEAKQAAPVKAPPAAPKPQNNQPRHKAGLLSRKSVGVPEPGTVKGRLYQLVNHAYFEGAFACLIVCNALVVAVEAQYQGIDVGFTLGFPKSVRPAKEAWPEAQGVFDVFGHIFGCVFAVEVVLKVAGLQRKWVRDPWNYVDFTIVVFWLLGYMPTGTSLPVNEQLLRVARLMRLLRLVRLVKTIQAFDSLMLMTTALVGSVQVLVWSVILLILVQATLALLVNQILTEYYFDESIHPINERQAVYEYFGTFTRAILSMFEMTLANWPPVCRLMSESWTEWWMLFALAHKLTIGFAVVGVINGVFMQETFKAASTDDRIMVRQRQRMIDTHHRKMKRLLELADDSGDGTLDKEEFRKIMNDKDVSTWMASMELDTGDIDTLYSLIDDGDEAVSVEELIAGVAKLKGTARRLDLAILMRDHRRLMRAHGRLLKQLGIESIETQSLDIATMHSTLRHSNASTKKDRARPSRESLKIEGAAADFEPIHLQLLSEAPMPFGPRGLTGGSTMTSLPG